MNFLYQVLDIVILTPLRALMQPLDLISSPKKILGLSLPARVAWFIFFFLLLMVGVAYYIFLNMPDRAAREKWTEWQRIAMIAVLLIVIPFVVYRAIKLWLEEDISQFPDIDAAWRTGVEELSRQGFELTESPLFLIVGVEDHKQAKNLMVASGIEWQVQTGIDEPAALHWFAAERGIFLVCTNAGRLSRFAALGVKAGPKPKAKSARPQVGSRTAGPTFGGTMDFAAGAQEDDSSISGYTSIAPAASEPAAPQSPPPVAGTMRFDPNVFGPIGNLARGAPAARQPQAQAAAIRLPNPEAIEQSARLEYVCRRLRQARQPVCPVNGILTVLPFGVLERGEVEGTEMQTALRTDLRAIHETLQIRCQVITMIGGMECESGFRELVRRVGRESAKSQRFGKGSSNLWNWPVPDQVGAIASHACGAFEDFTYYLFKEKDGLKKRAGNEKLYSLLCKIRTQLPNRIKSLIVNGISRDEQPEQPDSLLSLFGGCYFAATGDKEDRQAFVKGVFDKLTDFEDELDWTQVALVQNARYERMAQVVLAYSVLVVLATGGLLAKHYLIK